LMRLGRMDQCIGGFWWHAGESGDRHRYNQKLVERLFSTRFLI
jgi:hypothetical protein